MSTLTAKIQLRRDTAANWATNDPILAAGEVAFTSDLFYTSTDQQRFKIGDGVQTWSQLDYVPEGSGGTSYPENLYLTVVNKSADNLLASGYKVMKVITAQGQRLAVDYALADSDSNSADTIGVVFENINKNQSGKLTVIGEVTGINTTGSLQGETWADGDALYLSATTPGAITKVKPTAPNHGVRLGYVVYAHANQGKIYVKIDNGYEIGELHDCYLPSPTHNQGIFWSSGTTRYENKSIATALGYTPENSANKGNANGYAPLASDAKIDAAYLPAYVDEVLEYANLAAFPVTGASDKIYIALDTNKVYRWSGSIYIEVAANSGVWGAITGTITNQTDLQTALSNKQNSLGYTPFKLLAKNTTPITHTGTATETLLLSYNLTGEFDLNDIVNISLFNLPMGSGGKTIRLKVNTSNDLTGATQLATYTSFTTSTTFERTLYFSNTLSNVRVYAPTISYASDRASSFNTNTTTSVTYSFSGNVWILISVQLVTTVDICILHSLDITRKR